MESNNPEIKLHRFFSVLKTERSLFRTHLKNKGNQELECGSKRRLYQLVTFHRAGKGTLGGPEKIIESDFRELPSFELSLIKTFHNLSTEKIVLISSNYKNTRPSRGLRRDTERKSRRRRQFTFIINWEIQGGLCPKNTRETGTNPMLSVGLLV